jgi:solute carrier family 35 (adenosine 3'-phospho 5'-phosphosulfate transporter), member B3
MMERATGTASDSKESEGRGPLHIRDDVVSFVSISDDDDDARSCGSLGSSLYGDEAPSYSGDDDGDDDDMRAVSLTRVSSDECDDSEVSISSIISNRTECSSDADSRHKQKGHFEKFGIATPSPFSCHRRLQRRQQLESSPLLVLDNNSNNNNNITLSRADPVVVLGADISHLSPPFQFLVCAGGVFGFNLAFGYLQEFVAVEICSRNLGLFLAMMQFTGYTVLSFGMRTFLKHHQKQRNEPKGKGSSTTTSSSVLSQTPKVPQYMYISLGLLSAIDMAMTNMAMHYINYPAKTLLKSSRVVFTMLFGVLMAGKRYRLVDYLVVLGMVAGLAIFMQADATSSSVFDPVGVVMIVVSLLCDGAINVLSETIMKSYGVGQDELIFHMYSVALFAVIAAATFQGDLRVGMIWMSRPGTYNEWNSGASGEEITWNVVGKMAMIVLFSSMGFFGSSCSAAITKNFGALTMSMTSTARRATTLFISFLLFDNECTYDHIVGIVFFIAALTTKSCMSRTDSGKNRLPASPQPRTIKDLEMQTEPNNSNRSATYNRLQSNRHPEEPNAHSRQRPLRSLQRSQSCEA